MTNDKVKIVNVPKMPELTVTNLLRDAVNDKLLNSYLPDLVGYEGKLKTINRQFLFNVINTLKPEFFPANIRGIMEARKNIRAEQNNTFINVEANIYNLIMNSQQINRSKRDDIIRN